MSSKLTKEQYESLFNELFGIDIRWSKLSKNDLETLAELLTNPDLLAEKLIPDTKNEPHKILSGKIIEGVASGLIDTALTHDGVLVSSIRKAILKRIESRE